jgi:SAM-dependent methyltransferase
MLWDSREKARRADRGDIDLIFCHTCGHLYNAAFDPDRMQYSPQYDNALDYSPTFQKYICTLAQRLVDTYQLQGKDIIEIGCGQGEFLRLLAEIGQNRCLGFDPSYDHGKSKTNGQEELFTVIRDYYSEQYSNHRADFFACRQVLEHIRMPADFLKMIRSAGDAKNETVIFAEVPNAMYTLKELGIWDLIYEHCSYFTALSLLRVFVEAGLEPVNIQEAFGGQYLCIEGRPADQARKQDDVAPDLSFSEVVNDVAAFADNYRHTIAHWRKTLTDIGQSGAKAAVWGAGSKGITFLNVLPSQGAIDYVIDINPHKHQLYVPGTGQQVVSPDRLPEIRPEVIIVMNPLYLDEIAKMISELNISKDKDIRLMPVSHL